MIVIRSIVSEYSQPLLADRGAEMLVTDVRLPGMDGAEFARMVREVKPSLPIVFVSAYGAEAAYCSVPGSVGWSAFG